MKKVLVLGRQIIGEKNDAKLLAAGLGNISSQTEIKSAYFEDVALIISNKKRETKVIIDGSWLNIDNFDLIILINWSHDKLYSDLAHVIAAQAHKLSVDVWNSELIGARSMTKLSQLNQAADNDIPIPTTIFSISKEHLKSLYTNLLSLPLIAKDPTASKKF
jgi:glutathione synthase/RimK-type ligase-like ATP-grasp enzyme